MLFAEDGVLFSLLDSYESNSADLEDAIIKYVKGSAEDELEGASSPLDSGLSKKKKQHGHQPPPSQEKEAMAIGECEIGASPVMTKGLGAAKKTVGRHSPLQRARELAFK